MTGDITTLGGRTFATCSPDVQTRSRAVEVEVVSFRTTQRL